MAKVLTNASESFDKMKQEMEAIKVTSQGELKAMQDAIKEIEGEVRNNMGNNAGSWPVGDGFNECHGAQGNIQYEESWQ